MWKLRCSFYLLLCFLVALVAATGSRTRGTKWLTLSGSRPLVIARGGFSGVFSDSSPYAYQLALQTGLSDLHVWCNVQLTKDRAGICFPDINLQNASDIGDVYPDRRNTYNVNGERVTGYFSVDFTLKDLLTVSLRQRIYSRPPYFDGNQMSILTVPNLVDLKPPGLWLNIPNDAFFSMHNLSMRDYIISLPKDVVVNYISSPEVGFLKSIALRFRTGPTKLIFQILESDKLEPSTNQTYGSLLKNLTFIKTFAAGVLVPKSYIWPVDNDLYLLTHTSLVLDAHKSNLEVYASNFANDAIMPYNYSYNPVAEYLSFIDNGQFSVDGVLSDFPLTPSAAIDCFSHMGNNDTVQANILVISSEGASGDYPGCTDKAYEKAVKDGVEIIDCPVQISKDGIPFCMGSIDLRNRTNAAEAGLTNRVTTNPELKTNGIFTYDLNWSEIEKLLPRILNPYSSYSIFRNPKASKMGKLVQLSEFLAIANNASSVSGVLISIENAAYLAGKQELGVTDIVLNALNTSGYNSQMAKRIMIKSTDSAVLKKIKSGNNYELVYEVKDNIRDILNATILDIKEFASSVVVTKKSVLPLRDSFLMHETDVVSKLQAFNLSVYVKVFRNEFISQAWDFYSDANVEINTHVSYMGINGVITDYPSTAAKFKRNRCLGYKVTPPYMSAVQPGGLFPLVTKSSLSPAEAPTPILAEDDVVEAPLPPVRARVGPPTLVTPNASATLAPPPTSPNGQPSLYTSTSMFFAIICIICSAVL